MYLVNRPSQARATFLFAHGAGAPMDSAFMDTVSAKLNARQIAVVRFEFPYMMQRRLDGRKRPPDRQPALLACWREVIAAHASEVPLFIGGKSMGGRMATLVAREVLPIAGVVCLGYPFHPPGKPDRLRVEHFVDVRVPTLILQGERDPFGNVHEVPSYGLPEQVKVRWVPAGNHDLAPPKRASVTSDANLEAAAGSAADFMLGSEQR